MNIADIKDELLLLNAILDVCHGYTQAEMPNLKVLGTVLYETIIRQKQLYDEICRGENDE